MFIEKPHLGRIKNCGLGIVGLIILLFFLYGCAPQSELSKVQKDLELRMARIEAENNENKTAFNEARIAITESQKLLEAQKADMNKMRSDLAPLNQQIKLLREQDLTKLYGNFEDVEKKISDLRKDFQAHKKNAGSMASARFELDSVQLDLSSVQADIRFLKTTTTLQKSQLLRAVSILYKKIDETEKKIRDFEKSLQMKSGSNYSEINSPNQQMEESQANGQPHVTPPPESTTSDATPESNSPIFSEREEEISPAYRKMAEAILQGEEQGGDAEQLSKSDQYQMGKTYYEGRGVIQDYAEAAKWYRLAAERGYEVAQYQLGLLYENGQGVPELLSNLVSGPLITRRRVSLWLLRCHQ